VHGGEHHLLVGTGITGQEAENVLVGTTATLVGILSARRRQLLEALVATLERLRLEKTTTELAKALGRLIGKTVDVTGIDVAGNAVQSAAGTESAVVLKSGGGADEFETLAAEKGEERIVLGDVDG